MTSSSMTRITRGPSSRSRQACLRVTIDHPGRDPAGIGYPELLCAGVARLMLRDGVGCTPGSPAPRWMPRIHWVEAHAEEIEAVGALVLECLDVANEGGDPPGRDDSVVTQGLRRTRAALLEAQRADPWCQRLSQVVSWSSTIGGPLRDLGLQPAELEKLCRRAQDFKLAADACCIRNLAKCRS